VTGERGLRTVSIAVKRTARLALLGPQEPGIRELWYVLHGYGQLAAPFLENFRAIDDGTRLIVAPEALSRFYEGDAQARLHKDARVGASWMTREDRLTEIDDQVRYLDAVYSEVLTAINAPQARVRVLGFSQGTGTAARWLAYGTVRAERLILWGGEIPPDLDLAAHRGRFAGLDLTLVAGTRDQFITPKILSRVTQRLEQHAIPFHVVTFEGGHEVDEGVLRQLVG